MNRVSQTQTRPNKKVSTEGAVPYPKRSMSDSSTQARMRLSDTRKSNNDTSRYTRRTISDESTKNRRWSTLPQRSVNKDGLEEKMLPKRTSSRDGAEKRKLPRRTNSKDSAQKRMLPKRQSSKDGSGRRRSSVMYEEPASFTYLWLTDGMLSISALLLLYGTNFAAGVISLAALLFFTKQAPNGADPTPGMTGALSVVAGFGCLFLMKQEATFDRFLGHTLGRLWALAIGTFIYKDITIVAKEEEKPIEITIIVLEGRNLVPKDSSMLGKRTTSDPYVKIIHGPRLVGKTAIIKQTLDPKWRGEVFREMLYPSFLNLYKTIELSIFDNDLIGNDDPMGTVYLELPNDLQAAKFDRWYPVEKGLGQNYCSDATGELLVEIQIRDPTSQEEEEKEGIESETAKTPLTIITKILEGKDMVAKDTNLLGKPTTSDPYVVVHLGNKRLGKTKISHKTLAPKWNDEIFQTTVSRETINSYRMMELHIFDHDVVGSDDPMGTVYVKIPDDFLEHPTKDTRWYRVERGQGQNFCTDAAGALRVEMHGELKITFCCMLCFAQHNLISNRSILRVVIPHGFKEEDIEQKETPSETPKMVSIVVHVMEGRNLVAKDTNILGKPTTSDPYVKVHHGQTRLGKTKIVKKTLAPKWCETFRTTTVYKERYEPLELKVFDHDYVGSDDAMGTVYVPIVNDSQSSSGARWYPVERGSEKSKNYCDDATGELLIEVQLIPHLTNKFENTKRTRSSRLFNLQYEIEDEDDGDSDSETFAKQKGE